MNSVALIDVLAVGVIGRGRLSAWAVVSFIVESRVVGKSDTSIRFHDSPLGEAEYKLTSVARTSTAFRAAFLILKKSPFLKSHVRSTR